MSMSKQKQRLFTNCKRAVKNTELTNMLIDSVSDLFLKSKRSGAMSMCIFFNLFLLYMYDGIISDDQFQNNFVTIELDRLGFLTRVNHITRPDYSYNKVIHDQDRLNDINRIDIMSPYKFVQIDHLDYKDEFSRERAIAGLKLDCSTLENSPKYYTYCKLSKYGRKYIKENHLEPIFRDLKAICLKYNRIWIRRPPVFSKAYNKLLSLEDPIEDLSFPDIFIVINDIKRIVDNWHVRRAIYNFWKNHCIKHRIILPDIEHITDSFSLNRPNHVSILGIRQDYRFIHSRSSYLLTRDLSEGYQGTFMKYCKVGIIV